MSRIPPSEVGIDADLARRLLAEQHPDLASLAVAPADEGWDNVTFRLGPDLALRLPRRQDGGRVIAVEQRWLPMIVGLVPLPVPAPVRVGAPTAEYPWAWSVVPWIEGEPADLTPPEPAEGARLGAFLRALHDLLPAGAPRNPWREPPLSAHADRFHERVTHLAEVGRADPHPLRSAWERAASISGPDALTVIHGDLHPRNVLVAAGGITGVIDWGDLTAGDPATDLAGTWLMFPREAHDLLRTAYEDDDPDLWGRAWGWALHFAVMNLAVDDDPRHQAVGAQALERLLSE